MYCKDANIILTKAVSIIKIGAVALVIKNHKRNSTDFNFYNIYRLLVKNMGKKSGEQVVTTASIYNP